MLLASECWKRGIIPLASDRAWDNIQKRGKSMQWIGGDNEANYAKRGNKEVAPDSVWYDFNDHGYRSDEFDLTGQAPGIMFAGCSHTVGAGVPWDSVWTELVTNHYRREWNMPELRNYNLATSGASGDYVAMIVQQAVDVLRPLAVFVLWPHSQRMMWVEKSAIHFVPTIAHRLASNEHDSFLRLYTNDHAFVQFVRNYNFVVNKLSLEQIPFVCAVSNDAYTKEMLAPYIATESFAGIWQYRDKARDGFHRGIKSHVGLALRMIQQAQEIGFGDTWVDESEAMAARV